ncbi:MAG: integrase core domain-containing protein, partial [Mycobacterium sp.]
CGKVERFHQTLKRWLNPRPRSHDLADLQTQLDTFAQIYNTQRVHRGLPPRATPAQAYAALPKATAPGYTTEEHFRVRHDTLDACGKLTPRHAGRLHHLGIGITHAGTKVLITVSKTTVTVLTTPKYQLIASHTIDPDCNYWRNQQKRPGRWPGRSVTDDATQV